MLATLFATLLVSGSVPDAPPPPVTVSLNNGGQYSRGDYAQATFRASADGYVLLLQTDQDGRIRVLFPLDPGDDNFIRGGKTYKVIGRDNRGSFYLDQAGGSGMVYVAWSKSPFRFTDFVRGDHWDYSVFDQYSAADDPESQLTDLVLQFTAQGFDYAIDRYIVYAIADYGDVSTTTYVGVSGWPWPTYYTGGWGIGISFGYPCCYGPWYGYPAYGWGYPWYGYGWGYPGYGWGYPAYGPGYPVYGYPGYPGYGYPGYPGYGPGGYPGYRPYTFKPGGTVTRAGDPYRPRGDDFSPRSSVFQTGYRDRPVNGATARSGVDAATINGRAEAGRRPAARPSTTTAGQARPRTGGASGGDVARGGSTSGARRPSTDRATGSAATTRQSPVYRSTPSRRTTTGSTVQGGSGRARGWTSDGKARPSVSGRPSISPTAPRSTRGAASGGSTVAPTRRSGGSPGSARPSTPSSQPSARPSSRPGGSPAPAARGGSSGGSRPSGGAVSGGSSGGRGGAAPSGGGGGGGRRGR